MAPEGSDTFVNLVRSTDVNHKSQLCQTDKSYINIFEISKYYKSRTRFHKVSYPSVAPSRNLGGLQVPSSTLKWILFSYSAFDSNRLPCSYTCVV